MIFSFFCAGDLTLEGHGLLVLILFSLYFFNFSFGRIRLLVIRRRRVSGFVLTFFVGWGNLFSVFFFLTRLSYSLSSHTYQRGVFLHFFASTI